MMDERMKHYLYFPKAFILLIDEYLEEYYNIIPKEDFLHFFYTIERGKESEKGTELGSGIRTKFGRTENGSWKFKLIVDKCEAKGIITITNHANFDNNKHAKAYSYTQEFLQKLLDKELEFEKCEISEKTFKSIYKTFSLPTDSMLLKHYKALMNVDIDIDKAVTFAKTLTNNKKLLRTMRDITILQYKDHVIVIEDERVGRVFTSFNMMKKELREFCTYKGERLMSIDLRSSQPYLMASILYRNNPNDKDIQRFYDLVTNEDIYDWLAKQIGGLDHVFNTKEEIRTWMKELMFMYLFKGNKGNAVAQDIIKREFPNVFETIKKMKQSYPMWMTLQRAESDLFMTLTNEYVDRGCLNVHDSVYFPVSLRGEIEERIETLFKSKGYSRYSLHINDSIIN